MKGCEWFRSGPPEINNMGNSETLDNKGKYGPQKSQVTQVTKNLLRVRSCTGEKEEGIKSNVLGMYVN